MFPRKKRRNATIAAITFADVTLTAAGALQIQGSGAITLADLILSQTATVQINGVTSVTLDALTSIGTGTIGFVGADIILAAATLAATATLKIQGAASPTLAAVTLAGTGTLKVQGTATITLAPATLAATGTGATPTILPLTRTINNAGIGPMPADAFWTIGHPFPVGQVPRGSIVTATLGGAAVPVQGIASSTHADGSLAWTQLMIDLSGVAIAAGASKDLVLATSVGAWSTTTVRTNADWVALAHTVEITNLSTTSSSAADMDGAGTWTATFNNGASNTFDVYGQGPRGLWVTVQARFTNGATTHRFLYAEMEYWVTQRADLSRGPVAWRGPVIRNDEGFKLNPGTFTYDIAFKQAGSTVRSETGVPHIAFSWSWIASLGVEMEWSASNPNIWVSQDYTKLRKAFPALPFRDGIVYTGNVSSQATTTITGINTSTGVFTVVGTDSLKGHDSSRTAAVDFMAPVLPTGLSSGIRYWIVFLSGTTFQVYDTLAHALSAGATGKVIPSTSGAGVVARLCLAPTASAMIDQGQNSPGARNDLSIITEWGAAYIVANTQAYQRYARVTGYAQSHGPICVINDKTGKVPSLLNSTGSYPTPAGLIGAGQTGATYIDTHWGTTSFSADFNPPSGPTGFGIGEPNGWQVPLNHMPAPIFAVWLLEGGAIARELLYLIANQVIGSIGYMPQRNFALGVTTYYACGTTYTEPRTNAWNLRAYANAMYAAPDGSVEQEYFKNVVGSNAAAINAYVAYEGTNFSNLGFYNYVQGDYPPEAHTLQPPGVNGISQYAMGYSVLAFAWADLLVGDRVPGLAAAADMQARGLNNLFNVLCPWFASSYVFGVLTSAAGASPPGSFVSSATDIGCGAGSNIHFAYSSGGTDVTWSNVDPWWEVAINDKFRPQDVFSLSGSANAPPTPLTIGTNYFIVSVNIPAKTFKISATLGGSPITFTQTVIDSGGWFIPAGQSCPVAGDNDNYVLGNANVWPGDTNDPDGYMAVWVAAAAMQTIRGATGASAAYDKADARMNFTGSGNWNTKASWAYTRML